jgi:hypothetical protein
MQNFLMNGSPETHAERMQIKPYAKFSDEQLSRNARRTHANFSPVGSPETHARRTWHHNSHKWDPWKWNPWQ